MLPRRLDGERCLVAALVSTKQDADAIVDRIEETLRHRGAEIVGVLVQRRGVSRSRKPGGSKSMDQPLHPTMVFGSGKLAELAELASETSADTIVVWNPLSPRQLAALEQATGCRVLPFESSD